MFLRHSRIKLLQPFAAVFALSSIVSPAFSTSIPRATPSAMRPTPTVVGRASNFWLFSNREGFDLTHPASPSSPEIQPRVKISTSNSPVTISPAKTALVIIDMQNFFLSAAIGRQRGPGHDAEQVLLTHGIPAARKAGIQIVWLTWGITEEGLNDIPPTIWRIFGYEIADHGDFHVEDDGQMLVPGLKADLLRRKEKKCDSGLGSPLGNATLEDGSVVDAGRMLIAGQWNTALHDPLEAAFQDGASAQVPDVRFNKQRLSGLWGSPNELEAFLKKQGITTLLFSGVNTDQCVLATVQDASSKGFDTITLLDGCGTTSPDYAKQMVEYNCQKSWGFVSSCRSLAEGVEEMLRRESESSHKDEL